MTTTTTPTSISDMSPTEYAQLVGRPVPQWLNLDALVTPDEVAEIEATRSAFRKAISELLPLAARVRWASELSNRATAGDALEPFDQALGLEEIGNLALLVGYLFSPESCSLCTGFEDDIVDKYGQNISGLLDAVAEIHAERAPRIAIAEALRAERAEAAE